MDDNLLEKARTLISRPTSKRDLEYLLGGKVSIYRYEDILNFSLDDILGKFRSTILLYPNSGDEDIGHWVCLFERPGTNVIEYFDSYGIFPDDHIDDFNLDIDDLREPIPDKLRELFLDEIEKGSREIFWNETQFQSLKTKNGQEIATCGLWCYLRIKNNSLDEDSFKRLFYDLPVSQKISPDLLVCSLVIQDFPEFHLNTHLPDPSLEKALVVVD